MTKKARRSGDQETRSRPQRANSPCLPHLLVSLSSPAEPTRNLCSVDKKNLIAFLALSLAVLLLSACCFPPPQPPAAKPGEKPRRRGRCRREARRSRKTAAAAEPDAAAAAAPAAAPAADAASARRPRSAARVREPRLARSRRPAIGCSSRSRTEAPPSSAPSSAAPDFSIWSIDSGYLGDLELEPAAGGLEGASRRRGNSAAQGRLQSRRRHRRHPARSATWSRSRPSTNSRRFAPKPSPATRSRSASSAAATTPQALTAQARPPAARSHASRDRQHPHAPRHRAGRLRRSALVPDGHRLAGDKMFPADAADQLAAWLKEGHGLDDPKSKQLTRPSKPANGSRKVTGKSPRATNVRHLRAPAPRGESQAHQALLAPTGAAKAAARTGFPRLQHQARRRGPQHRRRRSSRSPIASTARPACRSKAGGTPTRSAAITGSAPPACATSSSASSGRASRKSTARRSPKAKPSRWARAVRSPMSASTACTFPR